MRAALTDSYLKGIKTRDHTVHWDAYLPCFGVRRGKHRLSFVIQRGSTRKTIATYPGTSLAKARDIARTKLLATGETTLSVKEMIDEYVLRHVMPNSKPTTIKEVTRVLNRHFALDRPMRDITLRNISDIINEIKDAPATANQATMHVKALFNWAASQQYIDKNPLHSLKKPFKTVARERVLTDTEIKEFLDATYDASPFSTLVRLLLFTGQRRQQIGNLRWEQVGPTQIIWDASEMKGNRSHVIPITEEMRLHLNPLPRNGPYVFPPTGYRNWKWGFEQLRAKLPHHPHWTLHDLRRTASTKMHELRIAPNIVERILHHAPPKMSGIYNRHNHFEETKEALQQYNNWLSKLWATSR